MDCEKFETTLIDELYDELDELTSAAAKRHVAGCARCAALLGGLRATRRIAVLPMVAPPPGLEDRILAAAKDAQKVVPIKRRLSGLISSAGSWAMRPQTAMAALFLLIVGSSALFVGRHKASTPGTASMTITAEGSPAASAVAAPTVDDLSKVDPSQAHGLPAPPPAAAQPPPIAMASASSGPLGGEANVAADIDGVESNEGKGTSLGAVALDEAPKPYATRRSSEGPWAGPGGGGYRGYASAPPASHASPKAISQDSWGTQKGDGRGAPFDDAMALYRTGRYDDAARAFDALAASGDDGAALWAARSVRDGSGGCAAALSRFETIAGRSFGSSAGYDATLEGGRCLSAAGATEAARAHFTRLLTVPEYASRAQAAIDGLSQSAVAARQAAPKAAAPSKAMRSAPPPQSQDLPRARPPAAANGL